MRAATFIARLVLKSAALRVWMLALAVFTQSAAAWSIDGHQIIAIIAETRLNESTWKQLDDILGKDRDGEQANISDAEICGWADVVRRQRRDTEPYHFVNIPHDAIGYDPERDDPEGDNIVAMIGKFRGVLADKTKPKEARREALVFLVHLVGDIHQPLHCAERNGDRGGNGQLVFFRDREAATNLHKVWDGDLLQAYLDSRKIGRLDDYAELLSKMVTTDEEQNWCAQPVKEWANEAHHVAVDHAYRDVPVGGHPPKISPEYVKSREKIVDRQLQRAGVRLAAVLNDSLAPTAATKPASQPTTRPLVQKPATKPRVVFLLDASGSMTDQVELVKSLVAERIAALGADAAFSVVLMRNGEAVQFSPLPLLANELNRKQAARFIRDAYYVLGRTDPMPALDNCFKKRPSELVIITDGFDQVKDVAKVRDTIIKRARAGQVKVELVLLSPRADVEFIQHADEIAQRTRGTVTRIERSN